MSWAGGMLQRPIALYAALMRSSTAALSNQRRFAAADEPGASESESSSPQIEFRCDAIPKALATKMRNDFWSYKEKRCTLCNESNILLSQASHNIFICHVARSGIVERAIANSLAGLGEAADLPNRTWANLDLDHPMDFGRLRHLSDNTVRKRAARISYLLQFLVDRRVIKYSLSVFQGGQLSCGVQFQTYEMLGDNVIKYVLSDRLFAMFPPKDGGLTGSLFNVQQLLDSNEGLRNIYEHFNLSQIIGCTLPNNKTKADVVEALFGELQAIVWAGKIRWLCESHSAVFAVEERYLMSVVQHLLSEMAHCVLQWAVSETIENAQKFLADNASMMLPAMSSQRSSLERASEMRPMRPPLLAASAAPTAARTHHDVGIANDAPRAVCNPLTLSQSTTPNIRLPLKYFAVKSYKVYHQKCAELIKKHAEWHPSGRQARATRGNTRRRAEGEGTQLTRRAMLSVLLADRSLLCPVDWLRLLGNEGKRHHTQSLREERCSHSGLSVQTAAGRNQGGPKQSLELCRAIHTTLDLN